MKRIIYTCILLWLVLSGCQKEINENRSAKLSANDKLAVIIPPIPNPVKTISRSKVGCISSSEINFDTLYLAGSADIRPHSSYSLDTMAGVNMEFMKGANGFFRYNFIKGNSYTVSISVKYQGKDAKGFLSLDREVYMPNFSAFTLKSLNQSNPANICVTNFSSLKTSNDGTVGSSFINGSNMPVEREITHQLTFTANECFEYLGLYFYNNSHNSFKSIHLKNIKISSSPLIQFNGESLMCVGDTQTLSYGSSGFTISDPVYWHVTGDLQIIGSNYGSSVQVKCTGPNGGTVGINSCENLLSDSNIKFNIRASNTSLNGTIAGNPLIQYTETYDLDYSIELKDGYSDFNWTISGSPNVVVTKVNNNTARLSFVGVVPFGTSKTLYLNAKGIGKCGISPNEVTKTIRFVYDRR